MIHSSFLNLHTDELLYEMQRANTTHMSYKASYTSDQIFTKAKVFIKREKTEGEKIIIKIRAAIRRISK